MIIFCPPQNTTKTCDKCRQVVKFDHRPRIRTCPNCGDREDQDIVAARNILRYGQEHLGTMV